MFEILRDVRDDDREHLSKLLDRQMLLINAGRERTSSDYGDLLDRVGFRLIRVIPTVGPMSILESEAV